MKEKGLSAEVLKLIACITMLLDHIGAVLIPSIGLRIIGRIAFPIYCFLLAEGMHYTHDKKRYGLRLLIGLLLSEIPFDIAFWGRLTWDHQSVMVTLLLGFFMLLICEKLCCPFLKMIVAIPFYFLAEAVNCDYGGQGILFILIFGLTREYDFPLWAAGLALIGASLVKASLSVPIFGIWLPIEVLSVFAMLPIALYSGQKATRSRWVQWAFYLFYPGHLAILALIRILISQGILPY